MFCTKRAPIRVKTEKKKWRIKGGEWKQTAIITTTEEGKLETWVWLVSQHPVAAAVPHGRVKFLLVGTWMLDCAAIGFPLSFCTGTEEIAGWEKVT